MNKILISSIVAAAVLFSCGSPQRKAESSLLFPFRKRTLFGGPASMGYIDTGGQVVIAPAFAHAEPFTEGLGLVSVKQGEDFLFGYIDSSAAFVIPPRYTQARPFSQGRALACDDGECGYIDRTGKFITRKIYSVASSDFYKGYAYAYVRTGTSRPSGIESAIVGIFTLGLAKPEEKPVYDCFRIDLAGRDSLLEESTLFTRYADRVAFEQQGHLVRTMDTTATWGFNRIRYLQYSPDRGNYIGEGTVHIPAKFSYAQDFYAGYAYVSFGGGRAGYIDTSGNVVVRFSE